MKKPMLLLVLLLIVSGTSGNACAEGPSVKDADTAIYMACMFGSWLGCALHTPFLAGKIIKTAVNAIRDARGKQVISSPVPETAIPETSAPEQITPQDNSTTPAP